MFGEVSEGATSKMVSMTVVGSGVVGEQVYATFWSPHDSKDKRQSTWF
jgi:hypothetical protein